MTFVGTALINHSAVRSHLSIKNNNGNDVYIYNTVWSSKFNENDIKNEI